MTLRWRRSSIRFFLGFEEREGEDMGGVLGVVTGILLCSPRCFGFNPASSHPPTDSESCLEQSQ